MAGSNYQIQIELNLSFCFFNYLFSLHLALGSCDAAKIIRSAATIIITVSQTPKSDIETFAIVTYDEEAEENNKENKYYRNIEGETIIISNKILCMLMYQLLFNGGG